ncbi:MAG: MoaD/ThiS family protein [Methanobrevibacter sp.]|uniref:MoaD/ThiS family protein n=1 Tax=Methanobrevibacter sp. TaxID=66852 RepID=UPI0025E52906|nr:MoaD/ThiS family protein [Methanobrevibacter sp.]MBR3112174.1 MoaD/ThiS family protein [Methanobrevibacter sp.]MBR3113828.1 MoaD/ThiS family protein [Methanobrevibacter sp.]MBR6993994.1 MoaD/ThiS family protein [Methanobrevibacter sp.]
MSFVLKYKNLEEEREIPNENYSIKDLLNDLELSAQTIVSKQNGELVIEDTVIQEDDEIQLVQIIYGG